MQQKITLVWENITVEISEKSRSFFSTKTCKKIILKNVSGAAYNNSLIAIMGPSGSGKTTLLGAISGRLSDKFGDVKINGKLVSNDEIKDFSGYVQQQDVFMETLTVMEYLKFMAGLQLSKKSKEYRRAVISKLISEVGLEPLKHTLLRNLSGGERRRLSLAGELINDPYILFCDEPTTGLDSFSAITVVQKLEEIALTGKIVLMSIHQPSSELFNYFNTIILLSHGRLIFQGSKDEAKSFFDSIQMHCPEAYNPADFYIKCLSTSEEQHLTNIDKISTIANIFKLKREDLNELRKKSDIQNITFLERNCEKSIFCEFRWLMWRSCIDMGRNLSHHIMGYLFFMITGLVLSVSYAYISVTDRNSVQNIQGILFFIVSELTFSNMYAVIYVFPAEMAILLKEKSLYSSFPYFISKLISLIPYCLLSSSSYMILFFLIVNFLKGFALFVNMSYVMFCTAMASAGLGLAFSATFNSIEYIDLIMGPLELTFMLLSGIWIRIDSVSPFFSWLRYLSPFFLAFESMSTLHWSKVTIMGFCRKNDTIPCFNDGSEVLESYGFLEEYDLVTYNVIYLHILMVLYCLIGFAGILRKRIIYSAY